MKRLIHYIAPKGAKHRGARIAAACFGVVAATGFALLAALNSTMLSSGFQPDMQLSQMDPEYGLSDLAIEPNEMAGETVLAKSLPMVALPKADRLPINARLVLAGSASATDLSQPINANEPQPVAYSAVTEPGFENETYVIPGTAYASLQLREGPARFDKPVVSMNSSAVPIHPGETPAIAEEEDDAQPMTVALPQPPTRPVLDQTIPLPKMRPDIPATAMILNPGRIPPARPASLGKSDQVESGNAGGIPMRPPARPGSVLAFLTPQNDAQPPVVAPPVSQPPATIETPTPFGIPYVLQTQTVDTACLRPELLDILREIETHYGRKVVITSGYRSRGREGSLHRTCRAADIIVPGVSSQSLAAYARSIPSVGGVGTYCHQSMIHVDVGMPRDWKYGCGSYFAMRDGTAHWGKVPQESQED